MRKFAARSQLLVVLLIATLACPMSLALPTAESVLTVDPQSRPSLLVVQTLRKPVLWTSIHRIRPARLMDDFSALASAPEEDNEIDDFEISSFSVSLDLFAPYSVNSLLLVSVYLVEPRSPKIHPVVRYCRLLC